MLDDLRWAIRSTSRAPRGRLFDERDAQDRPPVAIVSEALTRRYWGAEDVLGRQIRLIGLDKPVTIVGIVTNLQQPLSDDPRADTIVDLPYRHVPWPFMTLIVEAVARLDPAQAVGPVRSLLDVPTSWRTTPRLQAVLVGIGIGAALWPSVLAAVRGASFGVGPGAWGAPALAAVLLLAAACAATVLPALRVREREVWIVLRRE